MFVIMEIAKHLISQCRAATTRTRLSTLFNGFRFTFVDSTHSKGIYASCLSELLLSNSFVARSNLTLVDSLLDLLLSDLRSD